MIMWHGKQGSVHGLRWLSSALLHTFFRSLALAMMGGGKSRVGAWCAMIGFCIFACLFVGIG